MKAIGFLLMIAVLLAAEGKGNQRAKRDLGVFQLGKMIKCKTGRNALSYIGYGNWCGIGGSGTPVDSTDRCCYHHDQCYENLLNDGSCSKKSKPYLSTYQTDSCDTCSSSNSGCGAGTCECDRVFVNCLSSATYDDSRKQSAGSGAGGAPCSTHCVITVLLQVYLFIIAV